MSSSNCCFLTSIHISQEAGQVVWYSYLLKNFPQFIVIHTVTQSCPTLWGPTDCSPPDSSLHGILQARILEWVALPSFRGSSQTRGWTQVTGIADRFFTIWDTTSQSVQWLIHIRFFATPWTSAHQASLSIIGKDWRQDEKGTTEVEPQGKPIIQPACTWYALWGEQGIFTMFYHCTVSP